jgi:CHAT domain-containing protein
LSPAHGATRGGRLLLIASAAPPDPAFPPLLYAREEMKRVRLHFEDAKMLADAHATPRAYLGSAPGSYEFIHFVAHGVATRQRPLDSAIILASDGEGYKLYARDILAHRLTARLVTISSCLGAGRRAFQGEGLVGLAWAFLRAGAHQVIAALWEVNDRATYDLMDAMYAAIHDGRDPVDALRLAKLKMLRSRTIYRKPFYWAPFAVYVGS